MTKSEPVSLETSPQTEPRPRRRPYVAPSVVYEGDLETMAVVCDSAFAGFGNCRMATVPTCIRITT